jgi:4-phospho-D-threonate 3-dehydrogenase / 4-phospho-D-erythronate 3-dehydrogenase
MSKPMLPVAITMGDPAGVGPEIIVKAIRRLKDRLDSGSLKLIVIGSKSALDEACRALGEQPVPRANGDSHSVAMESVGDDAAIVPLGQVSALGGDFAYRAVARGVEMAMAGEIAGIVTAPLNKEALNAAGHHFAGHTDMLAKLTGSRDSVMMLAHGNMRVSHVTTHIALQDVPSRLTPERLRRVTELTHQALTGLGLKQPHIAIAALNPHAGEGGLFGREDIDVSMPTIERMRKDGMNVSGPVPGDTVFVKLRAGHYDAVVAMYHDQGHIPVKLLGFQIDPATQKWSALNGVNITLGLPIIRTSVDHGTAFDIAGKGIANEDSLIEAIDYALQLGVSKLS